MCLLLNDVARPGSLETVISKISNKNVLRLDDEEKEMDWYHLQTKFEIVQMITKSNKLSPKMLDNFETSVVNIRLGNFREKL